LAFSRVSKIFINFTPSNRLPGQGVSTSKAR
jgi:hypothetical protein